MMKTNQLAEQLAPPDLVDAIRTESVGAFLARYGGTAFLLVRVGPARPELAVWLGSTAVRTTLNANQRPAAMDFHTVLQRAKVSLPSASTNKPDAERVKALLKTASHFAVPLEKRHGAETAFADRISVGRAVNKDIVLRDDSVSKFHAWFEVDEGGLYLTDANSKNSTLVNGVALEPRKRVAIAAGDSLRFGSIDASICEPAELFAALQ